MESRQGRRPIFEWVAAVACVLLWGAYPLMRGGDGLVGQYYDNPTWTGTPVHSIADPTQSTARIARRWGDAVPRVFSILWTGYLTVGRAGAYSFATTSDDGSRLYIDGQLVVDNGGRHSAATRSGRVQLTPGSHRIRLEYAQEDGDFDMAWSWGYEGGRLEAVPPWALSRKEVQYSTALATRGVDLGRWILALVTVLAVTWRRNAWLRLINVAMITFVVAGAVPFEPVVSTFYYEYQIHLAFVRGLQWGVDVVATYGPWGFVGLPLFHPVTYPWMLLVSTAILAGTVLRLFAFVRRIHPPGARLPGLWTAMVFVPLTIIPVGEWSPALFCFHLISTAIGVEWILGRAQRFAAVDAVAAFTLGFLVLVKISAWPVAAVLLFASWFQSRRYGIGFSGCFLAAALAAWWAAGQSLIYLVPFLRLGLAVIGGFKDGLAIWESGSSGWVVVLFLAAMMTPLTVILWKFPPRRSGQWFGFLAVAAVFGQLFTAAFVRADGQHVISNMLGVCAVTPLLVAAVLSDRRWGSLLPAGAIVVTVSLLFYSAPASADYLRPRVERRALLALISEGGPSVLNARREHLLAAARANYPLSAQDTAGVGAILSGDVGIVESQAASFRLEPTVASYAAYTSQLQDVNAIWLERDIDWLLWCGSSVIDSLYPTVVDGKAHLHLATHFKYQHPVGRCALLRRGSGAAWRADAPEIHRVGFDQVLPIDASDGSLVWAELSVRETLLGRVVRTFLKPAPVTLQVLKRDGTAFVRDILPSMTRQGFLLSPVVEGWAPLSAIAEGGGRGEQVVGLRVAGWSLGRFTSDLFYHPEVTVRSTTIHSPLSPLPPQ